MLRPTLLRAARPVARMPSVVAPRAVRLASSASESVATKDYTNYPVPPGEEPDPQLNGYPQLPWESAQTRSPYGWWDQQGRKNFGEVLHESHDILGMWGPDLHKTTWYSALGQLTLAFGLLGTFAYTVGVNHLERPAIAREYPYNGLEKELGGFPARKDREEQE